MMTKFVTLNLITLQRSGVYNRTPFWGDSITYIILLVIKKNYEQLDFFRRI